MMSGIIQYLWTKTPVVVNNDYTVSVAESVTAGALSNALCSDPGASKFFKGGIVVYSIDSKKDILKIDTVYAEKNNFANPFTTSEMAKAVLHLFNARIGLSTTGYSLPTYRKANEEKNECELNIDHPYAFICLYDSYTDTEIIKKINFTYDNTMSDRLQRASVQTKVSLECKKVYQEYIYKCKLATHKNKVVDKSTEPITADKSTEPITVDKSTEPITVDNDL
jgi:PncC family amidohydrolase